MLQYPDVNGKNKCGSCYRNISVRGPTKTGKNIGCYYLQVRSCRYFHSFDLGNIPANRVMDMNQPPMDKAKSSAGKQPGRTCARAPCTKDAHGSCQNRCCKFCCVVNGGCSIKDHNVAALSQTQLSKLAAAKGAPPSLSATTPRFPLDPRLTQPERSFDELARLLSESDPVLHLQREEEANSRKQQEEAQREADLERLEEDNYRRAVAESLSLIQTSTSSSTPPTSSSNVSASRPLPTVSEPSTSLVVHGLPVTRVKGSNRPSITSHMSSDWMRAHEDRTKLPQALRKGQIDSELLKRFRIVWWSEPGVGATTIPVPSSDIPDWPKFRLADSPAILERFGKRGIDFYDALTFEWVECPLSYAHAVTTDGHLLLRRTGTKCEDFDSKLLLATQKQTSSSRSYMSNVRKSVASKAKRKGKDRVFELEDEDSDGEVEIVSDIAIKIKQEPGAERRPFKRPRLSPHIIPVSLGSSIDGPISIPSSPISPHMPPTTTSPGFSLDPSFPSPALSSPSATPPTPSNSLPLSPATFETVSGILSPITGPPPQLPGSSLKWPANMYAVDMVHGFRKMDELLKNGGGTYQQRFMHVFGQSPPGTSTYHDQLKRWKDATPSLREAFIKAGRTSAGQWSRFSKAVRLR
ncbi:hypothetical protein M413DRAFT_20720 [Hebeloma cylindrosporum]|uniref:Uncharacterized protein n=1 Tax=Hebeloma cylindrosporum TaxID=76867 RepID=A0A0C3BW39_HEBCY|nr:hypothetical protein M413DRAFT_20720 [Hebeloma cylindrosporum h7]